MKAAPVYTPDLYDLAHAVIDARYAHKLRTGAPATYVTISHLDSAPLVRLADRNPGWVRLDREGLRPASAFGLEVVIDPKQRAGTATATAHRP